MKILFWLIALLSIPAGLVVSVVCYFCHGLDLGGTVIGEVVCAVGMLSVVVSIVCAVLGIIKLRKGNVKKAVAFALAGVAYSGIIMAGIYIDDAVHSILLEKSIAEREEQLYGENWDAPPVIEGIPALYQSVLNKFYVAVRDEWNADQLMELSAAPVYAYYGDASLDNIGFILKDLNGDGVNELLIGTTAPVKEGGTGIFCIYSNPKSLELTLCAPENDLYYLHAGKAEGTYMAEIGGSDAAWQLEIAEGKSSVNVQYWEGVMDPAGRLTLELIPFSQYK